MEKQGHAKKRKNDNKGNSLSKFCKYADKPVELEHCNADVYYALGHDLDNIGAYACALHEYNKAIKCNPNFTDAMNNKAIILSEHGECKLSITIYREAINLTPYDSDLHYNLGISLYNSRQYKDAILAYEEAIKCNPFSVEAYCNKGIALCKLHKFQEAIETYDKAIELNSDYADTYYNKGIALCHLHKFQEAIEAYDKAIELNSDYANAYYNKGIALCYLKKYEDALTMYDKVLALKPHDKDTLRSTIMLLRDLKIISEEEVKILHIIKEFTYYEYNLSQIYNKEIDDILTFYRKKSQLEFITKHSVPNNIVTYFNTALKTLHNKITEHFPKLSKICKESIKKDNLDTSEKTIADLPPEIQQHIFSYLSLTDIVIPDNNMRNNEELVKMIGQVDELHISCKPADLI